MDVQSLVNALAERIGRPVTLEDTRLQLLAHSRHPHGVDDVRQQMILQRQAPEWTRDWIRSQGLDQTQTTVRSAGAPEHGMGPRVVVPVRARDQLLGWLWVLDPTLSMSDGQIRTAEETAAAVAVALVRQRTAGQRTRAELARMLQGLLSADEDTRAVHLRQAVARGLLSPRPHVCLTAAVDDADTSEALHPDATAELERLAGDSGHLLVVGGDLVGLVVADVGVRAAHVLHRRTGGPVGLSAAFEDPAAFRQAWWQSRSAAAMAGRLPVGPVAAWDDLGVYTLLAQIPTDALGPVLHPAVHQLRGSKDDVLLDTIEAYLDAGCQATRAAQGLHVHRGTLYYRLRRFGELTGVDLSEDTARLRVHLSLKARHLMPPVREMS